MSKQNVTRMRKGDRRAAQEAETQQEADAVASTAALKAEKQATRTAETPRLDSDDLMALASMDPSELAALMDGVVERPALEAGAKVEGIVTRVDLTAILVDIGAKSEAWIASEELGEVQLGDRIEAFVVFVGESEVKLSKQLSGDAAGAFLEEAHATGIPVEGHVTSSNQGGFDVRIGDARAFCPRSLMSRTYFEEPSVFVGQTLMFKVIEVGEKTVVSRRALEEELAEKFADDFWGKVVVGMEIEGTVRNVQPFGAFVDLGGVDGLIPRSELSWDHGANPADMVDVGEPVTVRVIAFDEAAKKITLSLKNPDNAPWLLVGEKVVEGEVYNAPVVRVTTFGAFVQLAEGLDGLLHTSRMGGKPVEKGTNIDVRVLSIDHDRKRISLGLASSEVAVAVEAEQVKGTVTEVMKNGVVVQLEDGRTAWLPANEVELPNNTLLAQRYRRGRAVEARVKDASRPERLVLTTLVATNEDWRATARKQSAKKQTFGTFGDLFAGMNLK